MRQVKRHIAGHGDGVQAPMEVANVGYSRKELHISFSC